MQNDKGIVIYSCVIVYLFNAEFWVDWCNLITLTVLSMIAVTDIANIIK